MDSLADGLSSDEVDLRRADQGPNRLHAVRAIPAWKQLLFEMVHFFALLLWAAGGLAIVAGMPQLGIAVFAVVVLNGVFAFAQERRAEHAAEHLRRLLPQRCTVIRDGVTAEIDAESLVVDDLVLLGEGDRISADLEITEVRALAVDTSSLTGESTPEHPLRYDVVFAGSFVVEGEASARVVAIGDRTRLASIARLTSRGVQPRTPLRVELERVSRLIAIIAIGVGTLFFVLSLALAIELSEAFLFGVGVAVALVPEGLLPTVTLSLALGAQRMADRNALVRHLEAAETLGSTTFICTDKTGTLTRNEMEVLEVWTPQGSSHVNGEGYGPNARIVTDSMSARAALDRLAIAAARCGSGRAVELAGSWAAHGDPMEAAIDALARRCGMDLDDDERRRQEVNRFPFDAHRKRMSVIIGDEVVVKGAADSVFGACRVAPEAYTAHDALADRGLRVLAVAVRPVRPCDLVDVDPLSVETDLELLGLIGLEDPPRDGAADALRACRIAGVSVAMVTGDHPSTASAIAKQVGLSLGESPVITGAELPKDDEELAGMIDQDGIVIARVTPEDKLRISLVLQQRGHVVAMTGDGVNDAPALRASSIGIAMGRSGTDVARDAADLVLLDDDFATIVVAIEQGRATFANIRRFLSYYLAGNVAELTPFLVWALSGARIPLAIGVLQILALDVGTSVLPALALGAQRPDEHVLRGAQRQRHLLTRQVFVRAFGVLGPTLSTVELMAFFVTYLAAGWRSGSPFPMGDVFTSASGAAFTAVVLGQAANAFACRSTVRPVWRLSLASNWLLLGAVSVELLLLAIFLVPPMSGVLGQSLPSVSGFAVALLAVPVLILVDAIHKRSRIRRASTMVLS